MGSKPLPPISVPAAPAVLGYLAGLLDGEGWIGATRSKGRSNACSVRVTISNTSLPMIEWLLENVGGSVRFTERKKAHWKDQYHWSVQGQNAIRLLQAVRPLLIVKGDVADAAVSLAMTAQRGKRITPEMEVEREALVAKIHSLNARGAVA